MISLSHAKAYLPEMDPSEMFGGSPEFNIDGSQFSATDYACCVKETHVLASQLVEREVHISTLNSCPNLIYTPQLQNRLIYNPQLSKPSKIQR